MENIAEAQHDQAILSTSMSSQNIQHSTSVSQEPIFIAQNVDTDQHNNDIDQDVSVGCSSGDFEWKNTKFIF